MRVYLVFSALIVSTHCSNGMLQNASVKNMIVHEIMNKVSNITFSSLSRVPEDKKEFVLNKIEMRLKKSAHGLPDGAKYVKFIMDEFKRKAYHNDEDDKNNEGSEVPITPTKPIKTSDKIVKNESSNILRASRNNVDKIFPAPNKMTAQAKQYIINDIAQKIETMAKSYIKNSQTIKEKKVILQKIEKRIIEATRRKHTDIHNQHSELKVYAALINEGLEQSIKKLLHQGVQHADDTVLAKDHLRINSRRMEGKQDMDAVNEKYHKMNMEAINEYNQLFAGVWNDTTIDPRCDGIVEELCLRIQALHKLSCGDGKIILLNQLCDGVADCWNEADETNCIPRATDKIQLAINVISDIGQSATDKCVQPMVEDDIFAHHHQVVKELLQSQLDYLQKYKQPEYKPGWVNPQEDDMQSIFLKKTVAETSMSVSALSNAMEATLCPGQMRAEDKKHLNNSNIDLDLEDIFDMHEEAHHDPTKPTWSPKSCSCRKQFCSSENCDPRCKRICWQKYSLNHWECQSIMGGSSVSLDTICDSKLDCFDETDETSCTSDVTISKYEANNLYDELINILSLKSISVEFENSRNKLIAQTNIVRKLQKLATQPKVEALVIKNLRDEYFRMLVHIYVDTLHTSKLEDLDRTYNFLHLMNEKMVYVMKRSHSGNSQVLSPAGCYCRNGTCALVRCTKRCNATCLLEPELTKYSCSANVSVNIRSICNGKLDCPNGDDEMNCSKEVCRGHHLNVLRQNLQNAESAIKSITLVEQLEGWKSKVRTSLALAEHNERPNHKILEDTVTLVLRDLVMAYAAMQEPKSEQDYTANVFRNISGIVKQTLKSCAH